MNRKVKLADASAQTDDNDANKANSARPRTLSMDISPKKDTFLLSLPFKNVVELRHQIESQVLAVAQASGDLAMRKAHNRIFSGPTALAAAEKVLEQPSYVSNGVDLEVSQLEKTREMQAFRRDIMSSVMGASYLQSEEDEAAEAELYAELRSLGVTTP